MTVKELVREVVNLVHNEVIDEGYETFGEMCDNQWFDNWDIRDLICFGVNTVGGRVGGEIYAYDDLTTVVCGNEHIPYGEFKRLFNKELKIVEG